MVLHRLTGVTLATLGIVLVSFAWSLLAVSASDSSESNDEAQVASSELEDNLEALLVCRDTARAPDLTDDGEKIVAEYDRTAFEIRRQAALEIRQHRLAAIRRLRALQDDYTRAARLDEAVALRDTIRRMLEASFRSLENPGTMHAYANMVGKSFLVRVTGRSTGSVYGTAFFTYDSDIATASVHCGALRSGETGVVIVSMISAGEPHVGSVKNGVRSYDYGIYPASYTIRRWKPTAEEIELGSLKLE